MNITPKEVEAIHSQLIRLECLLEGLSTGNDSWAKKLSEASAVRKDFFSKYIMQRETNETAQTS